MDEENKISLKDIPSYDWPTKEEGKDQYAKFSWGPEESNVSWEESSVADPRTLLPPLVL